MEWIKIFGVLFIVLMLASIVSVSSTVIGEDFEDEHKHEEDDEVEVEIEIDGEDEEDTRIIVREPMEFKDMLTLVYNVKNLTMPLLEWSIEHNVTLAKVVVRLAESFLEKAINTSNANETRAKAYAMVAAIIYGHAPVTAYPVLAKTMEENIEANATLSKDVILAVYNKALELRSLLEEAKERAQELNITVPSQVEALESIGDGLLNTSLALINESYVQLAFKYSVKGYHTYVRAYSILVKSVFVTGLRLGVEPDEPITHRIYAKKIKKEVVEEMLEKMPGWLRERVRERIMRGEIKSWTDLKHVIRLEIEEHKEVMKNRSIKVASNVIVGLITYIAYHSPDDEVSSAIWTWLENHGLVAGRGPVKTIRMGELKQYIENLVLDISNASDALGIELIFKVVEEIENEIEIDIGVEVDISDILEHYIEKHGT